MKTKSILSNHMVMLPVLFLAFAGYFFSTYRGNGNLASNFSLWILVASCLYSENPILEVRCRKIKGSACWHILMAFC